MLLRSGDPNCDSTVLLFSTLLQVLSTYPLSNLHLSRPNLRPFFPSCSVPRRLQWRELFAHERLNLENARAGRVDAARCLVGAVVGCDRPRADGYETSRPQH
ncbi:hypothetical protein DAEQUDRAFT_434066 [Daedalea quercina L-15889]|uniref:Uncharacterized protein n=1 Tax=Daedalea quercina L-15889 TaxID=1314783 RepID=A0A165NGZ2_9APHY|nr:hypothetical protein DAEQUDRAFT_434066 [Daedalea quercina L-15889]